MYCGKCGQIIKAGNQFCTNCGAFAEVEVSSKSAIQPVFEVTYEDFDYYPICIFDDVSIIDENSGVARELTIDLKYIIESRALFCKLNYYDREAGSEIRKYAVTGFDTLFEYEFCNEYAMFLGMKLQAPIEQLLLLKEYFLGISNMLNPLFYDKEEFDIDNAVLTGYSGKESTIEIPYGVAVIDEVFCSASDSINSVVMPNSVIIIGANAFCRFDNIEIVSFSEQLKIVGEDAFSSCENLEFENLPEELVSIGSGAFCGCYSLKAVTLPSSLQHIEPAAFVRCLNLTTFAIDADNKNFTCINGVLFSKDGTELIAYPAGKGPTYEVPENVTHIANAAFNCSTALKSLRLPLRFESFLPTLGFSTKDYCIDYDAVDSILVTFPDLDIAQENTKTLQNDFKFEVSPVAPENRFDLDTNINCIKILMSGIKQACAAADELENFLDLKKQYGLETSLYDYVINNLLVMVFATKIFEKSATRTATDILSDLFGWDITIDEVVVWSNKATIDRIKANGKTIDFLILKMYEMEMPGGNTIDGQRALLMVYAWLGEIVVRHFQPPFQLIENYAGKVVSELIEFYNDLYLE